MMGAYCQKTDHRYYPFEHCKMQTDKTWLKKTRLCPQICDAAVSRVLKQCSMQTLPNKLTIEDRPTMYLILASTDACQNFC